ncbi:MAG TPA: nucleoside-diphosphate sugar epimerase/dehydratase [Solirubrobacteraceae bacterium]|nr:nucleoside-diphosphate sugar epimerase/dehydratase [Solirubrobacteraceae bacterium]
MRRRLRAAAPMPLNRRSLLQLALDGLLVALAYYLAFQLRFDNGPSGHYAELRERTIWWVLAGSLLVLVLAGVYQRRWRYSSQRDYEAVARAIAVIVLLTALAVEVFRPVQRYAGVEVARPRPHFVVHGIATVGLPNGVIVLFGLLSLLFLIGVRMLARTIYERRPLAAFRGVREGERGVLIVGAGDGGRLVLREIARNRELRLVPVGFLDDDPGKRNLRIDGVRVRGDTKADLPRILDEVQPDEVVIAIPSAPGSTRARVVRACRERAIAVRTLPTVFELLRDQGPSTAVAHKVREVRVEDVLGREPVHVDLELVGAYLAEETVLVTGAGGSIGSELCRQIARVGPRKIVLLDHAEDNLFQIQRELLDERHVQPSVLVSVLADCKEEERVREILAEHRPTVVFHAAAYKHVGLMEENPVEAVRNNAIATRVVAHVAGQLKARRFVLVSTDKAVAPATVMGASKALAEFAIEAAAARFPETRWSAVRFGNVLGSSGSVVPIFEAQIARGGPVTVTDERMTRYFMTIPEAVHLIIQAGSLKSGPATDAHANPGPGGLPLPQPPRADVFVLEMGEPVRIVELARAMVELSGLDPDRDIEIEIVGRRAGEKLGEQLFNDYERALPTSSEKISLAERVPLPVDAVEAMFAEIGLLVLEGDAAGLAAKVSELSGARERTPAIRAAAAGSAAAPSSPAAGPLAPARGDTPGSLIHSRDP